MTNELLQSAKDEAAREIEGYYGKWLDFNHVINEGDMNEIIAVFDRAMEIYAERVDGWVSVEDKPLYTTDENGNWTCTDDGEGYFLAAVELSDGSWWVRYCTVEDGTGLCTVGEDDNEPSGFELSDITHYKKVSPPKTTKS